MDDRPHDDEADDRPAEPVAAVVEEQLRVARGEVFRAYVRARERARTLADEGLDEAGRQRPDGSGPER